MAQGDVPGSVDRPEVGEVPVRPARSLLDSVGSGVRWVVDNKGIVGLVLSGYLILKVIVVARGSQETAAQIVRSAGISQVVLGGIVTGLPFLAALALGLSMYRLGRHLHRFETSPPDAWRDDFCATRPNNHRVHLAWAVTVASVLVALAFTPWLMVVPVTALGLFLGLLEARRFDDDYSRKQRGKISRVVFVGLWVIAGGMILVGSYFGVLYTVWTTHESMQIEGRKPVVGYVIGDSGGWLVVITSGNRRVQMVDAKTVSARTACHVVGRFEQLTSTSFVQLGFWRFGAEFGRLPSCTGAHT